MDDRGRAGPLEWAVSGRPAPGEDESGDAYVVAQADAHTLVAVIDGLGHGDLAAIAAERASQVLRVNRAESLDVLIGLCHQSLAATRGAAMTLALVDHGAATMRWLGVGNVIGSLVRMTPAGPAVRSSAMLHGGVVGHQLPKSLRQVTTSLRPGDVVLLGTDGLLSGFDEHPDLRQPADVLAAEILRRSAAGTDDALVLVARYRGPVT